jgi:hypothetical protein
MIKFFILFLVIQGALFGAELTEPAQVYFVVPWTNFLATISAGLVQWFDPNVLVTGKILQSTSNGFAVSIEAGCNGVEATIVLVAAMLAFPAPWKNKIIGLIAASRGPGAEHAHHQHSISVNGTTTCSNGAPVACGGTDHARRADRVVAGCARVEDRARRRRRSAGRASACGRVASRLRRGGETHDRLAQQRKDGLTMRHPLARFVVIVLAWLPLCFVVWYFSAPLLTLPVQWLALAVAKLGFSDMILVEKSGSLFSFVTNLRLGRRHELHGGSRRSSIRARCFYTYGLSCSPR